MKVGFIYLSWRSSSVQRLPGRTPELGRLTASRPLQMAHGKVLRPSDRTILNWASTSTRSTAQPKICQPFIERASRKCPNGSSDFSDRVSSVSQESRHSGASASARSPDCAPGYHSTLRDRRGHRAACGRAVRPSQSPHEYPSDSRAARARSGLFERPSCRSRCPHRLSRE
jgi:hypothetical protein